MQRCGARLDQSRRKTPRQVLTELKQEATKANRILLATDPDREGEAIAWHIKDELNLDEDRTFRIRFFQLIVADRQPTMDRDN